MTQETARIYARLSIAIMRFKDDPSNPKRLVTLDNLLEELKEILNGKD